MTASYAMLRLLMVWLELFCRTNPKKPAAEPEASEPNARPTVGWVSMSSLKPPPVPLPVSPATHFAVEGVVQSCP